MKFYHSLETLTNKLQNNFQLDMWKENEIISRKPRTEGRTDIQTSPYYILPSKDGRIKNQYIHLAELNQASIHSVILRVRPTRTFKWINMRNNSLDHIKSFWSTIKSAEHICYWFIEVSIRYHEFINDSMRDEATNQLKTLWCDSLRINWIESNYASIRFAIFSKWNIWHQQFNCCPQ
jgi:hypothetical protein